MSYNSPSERFKEYLRKIDDPNKDKCCLCGKSPDQIRCEFEKYMQNPSLEYEDLDLDDILIMTYKTKKPVCAGCYFSIKQNPELVQEILDKPEEEIW